MIRFKLFSDSDASALEEMVNEWLSGNQGIEVIRSDIDSIVKPDLLGNMQSIEKHVFYILYRAKRTGVKSRHSAKEAVQEHAKAEAVQPISEEQPLSVPQSKRKPGVK